MMQCPKCRTVYGDQMRFCAQDGTPLVASEVSDPLIGRVIAGTYRLIETIGSGGFGRVYKARHERLPKYVAVKVLSAARALDPDMVSRFRKEVEAEALLEHPNIVRVYDHGYENDVGYYIAMEHMDGRDLGRMLDQRQYPGVLEIFAIIEQTAEALEYAHRHGLVHRDVKPENLFLAQDRTTDLGFRLKLLDFGLALLTRPAVVSHGHTLRRGTHVSQASRVLGSPGTMAPEVASGKLADHRADIYSLGAVLFELLTREVLFGSSSIPDMMAHIVHTEAPAPSQLPSGTWVPPEMDALVLRMLAKRPEDRPQTMGEVLRELERVRPATELGWAASFLDRATPTPVAAHELSRPLPIMRRMESSARPVPLVLVVDDDKVMRGLLRSLIQSTGCLVETVESAVDALDWLRTHVPPDALVTDLLMPGIDGLTLARTLRERGYDGAVLFCTSVSHAHIRDVAAREQRAWCIDKATELATIPSVLRRAGVIAWPDGVHE